MEKHWKELGFELYPWVNDLSPQLDYFLSLRKFALIDEYLNVALHGKINKKESRCIRKKKNRRVVFSAK